MWRLFRGQPSWLDDAFVRSARVQKNQPWSGKNKKAAWNQRSVWKYSRPVSNWKNPFNLCELFQWNLACKVCKTHTHTHVWVIDRPRHWHHVALTFCLCHLSGGGPSKPAPSHVPHTHGHGRPVWISFNKDTFLFPVGLNSFCWGGWIPNSGSIKAADTTRTKLRDAVYSSVHNELTSDVRVSVTCADGSSPHAKQKANEIKS